jgi:hypothetical protein
MCKSCLGNQCTTCGEFVCGGCKPSHTEGCYTECRSCHRKRKPTGRCIDCGGVMCSELGCILTCARCSGKLCRICYDEHEEASRIVNGDGKQRS